MTLHIAELDCIFISYDEPNAEKNYERLVSIAQNRTVHRVKDITGRNLAYRAAAELSKTDWFFAVFAKLQVYNDFDWSWQPDRLQEPKHYIFHAFNPINGLEYGHQAMIAYNKKITLANFISSLGLGGGGGGITTLNTLTALTQTFATGTSGTDFNISSATSTHTFNIPDASSTNRGLLTSADWSNFDSAYTNRITSLTTTGSSGPATLISNTLNIPQYTGVSVNIIYSISATF